MDAREGRGRESFGSRMRLILGNCLEKLKEIADCSVDSVVTDPPYGLAFMSKKWDYDVPSVEIWREVLRVLKPGGHLLSFGGTRTYHRMVVAIEDAGFEIRDQLQWIYSSGFPKSHDVSKAIDKAAWAQRKVIETMKAKLPTSNNKFALDDCSIQPGKMREIDVSVPATALAKQWQGFGTALKPANEPIVLARKPLEGTVAENVEKWGCGALNIDASKVGTELIKKNHIGKNGVKFSGKYNNGKIYKVKYFAAGFSQGRWPANVLFDEDTAQGQDWSRFFYVAKASKRERNAGLEEMPARVLYIGDERPSGTSWERRNREASPPRQNFHPTVKPIKLMQYLCSLITPPGGTVLDPFMGSGSTGCAAKASQFEFIGIEMEPEYFEIAQKRVNA